MEAKLPRSMCLVGEAEEGRKVLIEEYVVSFLQEMMKQTKGPHIIVFFGAGYEKNGKRNKG